MVTDLLTGDAGTDTLLGNAGNDTLDGGLGADIGNGGTGCECRRQHSVNLQYSCAVYFRHGKSACTSFRCDLPIRSTPRHLLQVVAAWL